MVQEIQATKPFVTPNGDYHAGMTENEAKEKGLYKKAVGLDFRDIDKDKDKTLSVYEIKEACIKMSNRNIVTAVGEVAAGITCLFAGAVLEVPTFGASTALMCSGAALIGDSFTRVAEACTPEGEIGVVRGRIKQAFKDDSSAE